MSGKITFTPSASDIHQRVGCEGKPNAEDYPRGTVWQCDECLREYVIVTGSQYNETYSAWRPLTEKNREGYDR